MKEDACQLPNVIGSFFDLHSALPSFDFIIVYLSPANGE